LFYKLQKDNSGGSRKLVVFSDSREDAAQISNGVERNHYSDLLREAVAEEIRILSLGEPELLSDLEAKRPPSTKASRDFFGGYPALTKRLIDDLETVSNPPPTNPQYKKVFDDALERVEEIRRRGRERLSQLKVFCLLVQICLIVGRL